MNEVSEVAAAPAPAPTVAPIPRPKRSNARNWSGAALTAVYLAWAAYYAITADVFSLGPEKVADFLAGIFAPLAFLWLVLGFFQQGDELRMSGDALWLQGEELRNSVEQQRQLVETQKDAIAFERERMDDQRRELKRQAQPNLFLQVNMVSYEHAFTDHTIVLVNRGSACTDLQFQFEDHDYKVSLFERGEQNTFRVQIPINAPTGTRNYTATFLDGLAEPGAQTLSLLAFTDEYNRTQLRAVKV